MTATDFIKNSKWFAIKSWGYMGAADSFKDFVKFMVGFPAAYVRFMRLADANR